MTDPHEAAPEEDPEQHIGDVVPEPWLAPERPRSLFDLETAPDPRDSWPGY